MRSREVASTTLNVSPYLLAAVFYLVITIPLGRFVQQFENKLAARGGRRRYGELTSDGDDDDEDAVAPLTTHRDLVED